MRRLVGLFLLSLGALAQTPVGQVATRDVHALLWLPDGSLLFGHHDGIQVSKDGGRTWQDLVRKMGFDAMALTLEGTRVLAAGHWVLAESQNGGKTWRNLRPKGLPAMDLHGYAASGGFHFALEATSGYFLSQDGGKSFRPIAPKGLPRADMAAMVFQGKTLYVAPMGQGLYQSPDGGQTFTQVPTPEREIYALAAGAGTLYLGGKTGLWQRTPVGWKRLWQGTVLALAAHPQEAGRLVFIDGQGRVWKSP
ncbi:sialidase family protein [Thermus sp. FJN-A]